MNSDKLNIVQSSNNINIEQEIKTLKEKYISIKGESKTIKDKLNQNRKEYNLYHKEYTDITSSIIDNENKIEEINIILNKIYLKENKLLLSIRNSNNYIQYNSDINNNIALNNILNCFLFDNNLNEIYFQNANELINILENCRQYFLCNTSYNENYDKLSIINKEKNKNSLIFSYIEFIFTELNHNIELQKYIKKNEELNIKKNNLFISMKCKEKDINNYCNSYKALKFIRDYIKVIIEKYNLYINNNSKNKENDIKILMKLINDYKEGEIDITNINEQAVSPNNINDMSLNIKSEYDIVSEDSLMSSNYCFTIKDIEEEIKDNSNFNYTSKISNKTFIFKNNSRNNYLLSTEFFSNNIPSNNKSNNLFDITNNINNSNSRNTIKVNEGIKRDKEYDNSYNEAKKSRMRGCQNNTNKTKGKNNNLL